MMIKQIAKTLYRNQIINPSCMWFAKAKEAAQPAKQEPKKSAKQEPKQTSKQASKQKKVANLLDKPYLINVQQLQKQLPEIYNQLTKQAADLEQRAIKDHKWRMKQLTKRITPESIQRLNKINGILNGLTEAQKQYLKFSIIKKVQNIQ